MRSKVIGLAAAIMLGTAAIATGAMAHGGHGGHGGMGHGSMGHGSMGYSSMRSGSYVSGHHESHRMAMRHDFDRGRDFHHRFHHRRFVFIGPGFYGWDLPYYDSGYDSCYVQTANGWVWVC
jgi:hypothetical protein